MVDVLAKGEPMRLRIYDNMEKNEEEEPSLGDIFHMHSLWRVRENEMLFHLAGETLGTEALWCDVAGGFETEYEVGYMLRGAVAFEDTMVALGADRWQLPAGYALLWLEGEYNPKRARIETGRGLWIGYTPTPPADHGQARLLRYIKHNPHMYELSDIGLQLLGAPLWRSHNEAVFEEIRRGRAEREKK